MKGTDPGLNGALVAIIAPTIEDARLRTDTPFSVADACPRQRFRRKYPTGDWMTSPQWFEEVERPFTSYSFVDLLESDGRRGILVMHRGSQQFVKRDDGIAMVMTAQDPWDEGNAQQPIEAFGSFCLMPHGTLQDAERVRAAVEYAQKGSFTTGGTPREPGLEAFGALEVTNAPNVLAHALYRDSLKSGEHLPEWAGHRMARESAGACTHPYVIRLVEWNGEPAEVVLKLPGPVALAAKTNLMGECGGWAAGAAPHDAPAHLRDTGWLSVEPSTPPDWARGTRFRGEEIPWSQVRFRMRPREIATVMADLVMGRKEFRDLDAKREVWATIHRVED
jgi:alpha-mannosidase